MIIGFQTESCSHLSHFLGHLFCRTSEGRVSRIGGGGGVPRKMRRPIRSRCLYNEGGQLGGGACNVMLFCFHSRLLCILLSYGMMQQRMHACALHIDSDGIVHPEMND
jgi:hypothetical protein